MESKLKTFFATAFFRGLGALSILILYYTITRFYSPHDAAHLFFVLTIAAITTPLMLTGLNTLSVKRIPILDQTASAPKFIASILWKTVKITTTVSALMLAIGAILWATNFYPEFLSPAVLALFFAIPTFSIIGYFFQGKKLYNISIFILNICNFLLLSLAIAIYGTLLKSAPGSSRDADVLILITSLLTLGLALFFLYKFLNISAADAFRDRNSVSLSASDQRQRLRFWIILVLLYTSNWLPQIAYYFAGARADYSYFSVAERLGNVINFFVIISNFFLAPIASELYASDKLVELRAYFIRITRLIVLASLPFAAVLIFFPGFVLSFFGKDYREGSIYLVIIASTQLFNVAMGSVNTLLAMTGSEKIVLYSTIVAIVLELVCILVLGPLWGGIGFAVAYSVNIVVQNGLAAWFAHKRLGVNIFHIFSLRHW